MVDLVKIRKKKQKKDVVPGEEGTREEAPQPSLEPSAAAALPPEPQVPPSGPDDTARHASKLEQFKQQAGKRRETQAATAAEAAAEKTLELLTFVIAGEQYAVDIERIVEIVTPRPVTRIPNAEAAVLGIMSLRGTIVALVDVRRKLRHGEAAADTADTRIVVIDFHNEMIGFLVDRVLRVVKIAAGELEAHPVVHATELDESIRGVFRAGGALTILLDLDKLLDSRSLAATGQT